MVVVIIISRGCASRVSRLFRNNGRTQVWLKDTYFFFAGTVGCYALKENDLVVLQRDCVGGHVQQGQGTVVFFDGLLAILAVPLCLIGFSMVMSVRSLSL